MNCTRVTGWIAALGIGFFGRSVSAQPTSPPAAEQPADGGGETRPVVVPPRLVHDPGVVYPKAALDERFYERVEVALLLELNDAGAVVKAKLEGEASPAFAEEALRAAQTLEFEPALRDG